jgi:hypothetical protein
MPAMHAKRRDEHTAQELIAALRRLHCSPVDLRDLVQLVQDLIAENLDHRAADIKKGCQGVPLEVIKNDLKKQQCACAYALRLNAD